MGFSSSAFPQRLQPARVLFELRQLILAIDGHHTLQQLSRLGDLAFILSDPGEQVAGPGHAQLIAQAPTDPETAELLESVVAIDRKYQLPKLEENTRRLEALRERAGREAHQA